MGYDFLYQRGFLITNTKQRLSIGLDWVEMTFKDYKVLVDSKVNVVTSSYKEVNTMIIGNIIDPINNELDSGIIAETLSTNFDISEDRFFDYLDCLSGRFVIIIFNNEKEYVIQDAIGSRSVFYDKNSGDVFISSHAELIADINGYDVGDEELEFMNSDEYTNNIDSHFPGISTPYKEIKMLTPNTLLNVKSRTIKRFFPRQELDYQEVNYGLIKELATFFTTQMNLLSQKNNLAISLTAGLDSRMTLASSKSHLNDIYYYTLTYGDNSQKDAEVAKNMCDSLGIKHNLLPTKSEVDREFLDLFLKNTSNMSSEFRGGIAKTLYQDYPSDYIHVKSNASEICRAYFKQLYGLLPNKITPKMYSKLYRINTKSDFVIKSFKEYIETTELAKSNIYNYDHYDLFYWEHRIGNWQSLCLYEWDIAQDTFIPFGNRYLLMKMLSVPERDRLDDKLYYEIIKESWEDTLNIPVNPFEQKNSKLKSAKKVLRRIKLSLT